MLVIAASAREDVAKSAGTGSEAPRLRHGCGCEQVPSLAGGVETLHRAKVSRVAVAAADVETASEPGAGSSPGAAPPPRPSRWHAA